MKHRLSPAAPLLAAALFVITALSTLTGFEPRAGAQSAGDPQHVVAVASGPKLPSSCSPTSGKVYFNLTVAASGRAVGLYRCSAKDTWTGPGVFANVYKGSAALDFGATAAGSCDALTITVTGAASGDVVSLGIPAALAGADSYQEFWGYVSASNTVTVKRCNPTNSTTALSNPAAATVTAVATRP
ncbi:MAG TPA: hypothetical protein VF654_04480 [Pyrinomonadaceae bacterium]|jgi:hypothetical protein